MELLENISTNTKPKDSCYIVCRGNSSSIQTTFSPALEGRGYEIAVVGLSTYYSYPNITEKNNRIDILKISKGGTDVVMYEVALDIGCYEIKDINEGIKKNMEWKKKDSIAIAIGDAKAIQGNNVLYANKIVVFFNKTNRKILDASLIDVSSIPPRLIISLDASFLIAAFHKGSNESSTKENARVCSPSPNIVIGSLFMY